MRRWLWPAATLLWMALIFGFSAQTAAESSELSEGLVTVMLRTLMAQFRALSPEAQEAWVQGLQFIVRKSAHAAAYAVLALGAYYALIGFALSRFIQASCANAAFDQSFSTSAIPGEFNSFPVIVKMFPSLFISAPNFRGGKCGLQRCGGCLCAYSRRQSFS